MPQVQAAARWFKTATNRDVSTGPLVGPLAHSLAPLIRSLRSPHDSLRLFVRLLADSLLSSWEIGWFDVAKRLLSYSEPSSVSIKSSLLQKVPSFFSSRKRRPQKRKGKNRRNPGQRFLLMWKKTRSSCDGLELVYDRSGKEPKKETDWAKNRLAQGHGDQVNRASRVDFDQTSYARGRCQVSNRFIDSLVSN